MRTSYRAAVEKEIARIRLLPEPDQRPAFEAALLSLAVQAGVNQGPAFIADLIDPGLEIDQAIGIVEAVDAAMQARYEDEDYTALNDIGNCTAWLTNALYRLEDQAVIPFEPDDCDAHHAREEA